MINRQKLIEDVEYLISHTPEDSKEHYAYKICKKLVESQPPADQWIPCSERLPEKSGAYIVTMDWDGMPRVTRLYFTTVEDQRWLTFRNVTAWMPLPEPYKGVE